MGALAGPRDLEASADPQAAVVETLYFGGGTPSLLDAAGIARIVAQVAADRTIAPETRR